MDSRVSVFPDLPLTPQMRSILSRMQRARLPRFYTLTPQQARAAYAAAAEVLDLPRAPLPRVEDLSVPARDGAKLPARLYAPSREHLPVLLYFHGGGFTIGGIETHDSLCRQLVLQSGAAVVSLDYRLAPEYRFPTASNDAWDALQWLAEEGKKKLGLDSSRLAVGGDSAGGTLAAVSALEARDAGLPLALQLLFYPGTTAMQDLPSHARYAQGPMLDEPVITWFFSQYIATDERTDWRFAPLLADEAEGLAPAWIGLAEIDPLVDEGIAYGDKLRAAGVPVELEIWRGVVHDFIKMARLLPEGRQAQTAAALALKKAFEPA